MKKYTLPNLLIAIVIMLSTVMVPAYAASPSDEETYSLAVRFYTEEHVLSGVNFKVYNAFTQTGEPRGAFAAYDVDADIFNADSLGDLALTLSAYAAHDKIPADAEQKTDLGAEALFSDLPAGVYLVVGDVAEAEKTVYYPKPFIVSLPYVDEDGEIVTDMAAEVKYDRIDPEDDTVDRSAVKVWEDNDSAERPGEVTVQLLRDGEEYDSAVLSEANSWSHTWSGLEAAHDWKVIEAEVPEKYTVLISQDGGTFTVTNIAKNSIPEQPTSSLSEPDSSVSPTDSEAGTSESQASSSAVDSAITAPPGSNTSTAGAPDTLPKTGNLRWPVPVLFFAGFAIFLIGVAVTKLNENEKDEK